MTTKVHNYRYFLVFRMLNGFAEAFGYPTLIKMLDHYFCHEVARDFIMTAFGSCKFLGKGTYHDYLIFKQHRIIFKAVSIKCF